MMTNVLDPKPKPATRAQLNSAELAAIKLRRLGYRRADISGYWWDGAYVVSTATLLSRVELQPASETR